MIKMFQETGFLSPEGIKILEPFQKELNNLLKTNNVKAMDTQEVLILQAALSKIVGDAISNLLADKRFKSR